MMIEEMNIKAVFFDVGGVCLSNGWDEHSREAAAEQFSFDFEKTEKVHELMFEDLEKGDLTLEDYIDAVYFSENRAFTREDIIRFMKNQSRAYDTTLEILEELNQQRKYKMATINNESFVLNLFRIEKFGLNRYFSNFFSSAFLHMRKPDGKIFRTAVHVCGLKPSECLFIDDREENIDAARYEGYRCIHLPVPDQLRSRLSEINII